jgi:hypothetical protein
MINEPIKITDLKSLYREKQRLKMFCSYQEDLITDKLNYIKNNAKQLIGEEFLPYDSDQNKKVSGTLDWVNEFVLGKFFKMDIDGKNKLSGSLVKLAEVGAIRLFNKFIKKKM